MTKYIYICINVYMYLYTSKRGRGQVQQRAGEQAEHALAARDMFAPPLSPIVVLFVISIKPGDGDRSPQILTFKA